ncbi:hypothetical protein SAMN04488029_3332 [Reichenbachiella faecimaris]|uniref:Uncharacterized protein n=1 Tax=Reichenbachiella faecimaris TaxID=692418 RepID=A0A1W2GLC5_REIFA|nr:hypothetical protein [Reichenbachiella faecimaris]SMD37292.1 hypothetical protein SAMN04488029_3332 [Reichenbachiella faecimaris]
MLKRLKILGITLLAIFLTAFLLFEYMDEGLPEGVQSEEADQLARTMMASINHQAWQNTGAISWGYDDRTYVWDKKRHLTQVDYDGNRVQLDINKRKGFIVNGDSSLAEEKKKEICHWAWRYWCNDSFWLNPISKIFDPGTERSIVTWHGKKTLLVTYTSGGSTPGDSYLWILDENGRPKSWKLWVSIIPIGGMRFSWDKWVKLETGVWVSTYHFNPVKTIPLHNPVGKLDLREMYTEDIFTALLSSSTELISY